MKKIIAAVLLCLLLCGCEEKPQTKTIWVMTSSEFYTDPDFVTKTEFLYDQEGYLRRQTTSYAGGATVELIAAQWDQWGHAVMLYDARYQSTIDSLVSVPQQYLGISSSSFSFASPILLPNCTVRKYDDAGNLLYTATASPGTRLSDGSYAYDNLRYTAIYTYDEDGNMLTHYSPNESGYSTLYRYTYKDGLRTQTQLFRVSNSYSTDLTKLDDSALKRYLANTTVHTYDRNGRQIRTETTSASGSVSTATFEYYTDPDTGNTTCICYQAGGHTTVTVTDEHGNVLRTETDAGNSTIVTTYSYTAIEIPANSPRKS